MDTVRRLCVLGCLAMTAMGCSTLDVRVDTPTPLETPAVENQIVRAEYVAMSTPIEGKGTLAVRFTNRSTEPIELGGDQGASLPTSDGNKAWLVYRGHEDLKRLGETQLQLQLSAGDARVSVDVPEEGAITLAPGQSKVIVLGYELVENERELAIDLYPLLMNQSARDDRGQMQTLHLRIPVGGAPTLTNQAKNFVENTKLNLSLGGSRKAN